jgi:predicted nucleotidyltransferase
MKTRMKFNQSLAGLIRSPAKMKIAEFLLTHESSMSEREIASVLKVSHMSVNRIMRELADAHLVSVTRIGNAHLWKVNRRSYAFRALSGFIQALSSEKGALDDLKKLLARQLSNGPVLRAVLFGSIAQGVEKANSDIDLFVLVRNDDDKTKAEAILQRLAKTCFEAYGNVLSPYVLTEKEAQQKGAPKILSEIEKGIQVYPVRKDAQ